jgi:NHLM bacteriocin system ABC transporter peptidase/ATP-binding protein
MTSTTPEVNEQSEKAPVINTGVRVKTPKILQMTEVECGAASLCMILAQKGRWVSLSQMRKACGISRDGATARDLVSAAADYGLTGAGHLGDPVEKLDGLPMPAIIWVRRSHFVVLEGAHDGKYWINDPGAGQYVWDSEEFFENYSGAAITFSETDAFTRGGKPYSVVADLRSRLTNSASGVWFAIITGLLAMILGVLIAPLSELFVNLVLGDGLTQTIGLLAGALLAVGVIRGALTLLQYGVLTRLQTKFSLVGSADFLERLVRMPALFYMQRSVGDLSQRITYNSVVAQLLATQLASAGIAVLGILAYAVVLIWYQWTIGLVVLALALVNLIVLRALTAQRTAVQNRITHAQNELRGTTVSTVRSIETLKATGMEDQAFTSLAGHQARYVSAQSALVTSSALLGSVPTVVFALTSAAILILGGSFVIAGTFTIGGLLAVQALSLNLNSPLQTLTSAGSQLQLIGANLKSLDDITAEPEDARYSRDPQSDSPTFTGHIELQHVTFGYSNRHSPVINNLSFTLETGKRIALVGVSGAGKSTIGNLAAGLLEPWSGVVLFEGQPLSAYAPGELEGHLAKVDQNIVLFEGTVRENVSLWDPTVPEADIRRALEDAGLLADVLAREGGLDARVAENGRNFSGGQCQRMEIARALAQNPRAIILDEATSALDTETEKSVDDALRARGVSCLIIAHRLSTVRDADEIIVLARGGDVVERGTHTQLMAAQGLYCELVSAAGQGGDVGT